jgi:hypothetical protein
MRPIVLLFDTTTPVHESFKEASHRVDLVPSVDQGNFHFRKFARP